MAKISLRGYKKEIENLIDRGQLEEAIAHSKHILTTYPKHIDSYRLLGKAYLEAQKYKEAGDIFQRVLSSIPDDFISHIGLSIFKEDGGDLDAAIWHMERAFEAQPSNTGIQQELKRLYGRRDGVEPVKVRLTKGALVRMYARSNLHSQAIAEVLSALAEDPSRIDLEITLAQMYYLSGRKLDATEISSNIVAKLPYCFEANRILAEVLADTTRAEDAKIYRERVISLDPYYAFTSGKVPECENIPENAVMIERLSWQSSGIKEKPLEWSLPVKNEQNFVTDSTPDWLSSAREELAQPERLNQTEEQVQTPPDTQPVSLQPEEAIPDWMKTAGWQPSEGSPEKEFQNAVDSEAVVPAEIPTWLKEIAAPASEVGEESTSEESFKDESNPLSISENPVADLQSLQTDAPPVSLASQPIQNSGQNEDIPEWLRTTVAEPENPTTPTSVDTPSVTTPVVTNAELSQEQQIPTDDTLPIWLKEIKAESDFNIQPSEVESEHLTAPEDEDLKMPWLDSLGQTNPPAEQSTAAPKLSIAPEIQSPPSSAIPTESGEWLEEVNASPDSASKSQQSSLSDDMPEWLRAIEITPEGEESLIIKETSPLDRAKAAIPDWLRDMKQETPPEPAEKPEVSPTPAAESTANVDMQEWLSSLDTDKKPEMSFGETPTIEKVDEPPVQLPKSDELTSPQPITDEKPKEPIPNFDQALPPELLQAEQTFNSGELSKSISLYKAIIKTGNLLDLTIASLQRAIEKDRSEPSLWQTLGDAYAKHNQLHDALDAYNKAEELLQ